VNTLKGIIHNGQVVLPQPTNLPEGTEVEIVPVGLANPADEGPETPDEICRVLAAMDEVQPFEMTDRDRAMIELERQARRDWEKARFNEHAEGLREIWE